MIRVGFSTHTNNIMSRVIRWFTHSKVSHVWLLVEDTFFGVDMVMEATETGFRLIPYANFVAEGNTIVAVLEPAYPLDTGVQTAVHWLGERYDFAGLFGSAFVMLGRWLKRKWRNPLDAPKSMFCSEAVTRVLQASAYPGAEALDSSATTPQDLLVFLGREKA
jgi:hypothetical protein